MKKNIYVIHSVLILLLLSIYISVAHAQQIKMVPIPSSQEFSSQLKHPSWNEKHEQSDSNNQQQLSVHQQFFPPRQMESLSEFEQYISEKIDITEKQFEILQKYKISFSQSILPPPNEMIRVPVRIIKKPEKGAVNWQTDISVVDAGFLIGTQEEIHTAFKILAIKSPFTITAGLRQFGYDLFREAPSSFAPYTNVPVGPGYVLGPGDEVRISIWGKVEGNWNVVIDRNGHISLPKVGIIGITGLTFKELKSILHKEFSKYYTGFEMNVSMGTLRTIRVYVVGNASRPGAYTLSSLSTLVNALFEAGGPSKKGSLRDLQLKRNGETVKHFDMYNLLLKGDKSEDVRLMSEDVIFIPSVGHLAAIAGSVINPAIYELKEETSLFQLIEMAGGLNDVAFKGRIQIARIIDKSRQIVFESKLDEIRNKNIILQSGDIVKVFQILQDKKVVWLSGAVNRAGEFGFSPDMTVRDLIHMAGGLKYYAFTREAELTRIHISNEGPKTEKININIEKALSGEPESNILLKENDYLFIRTIPEWKFYQIVSIKGEVKFPGDYIIKKGEKISSLINRAGGYTGKAYQRGATFTRERIKKLQQKQLDELVGRLERELLGRGAVEISSAASHEEAKIKELEYQQKRDFLEKLKSLKAQGRMVIVLDEPERLETTQYDLELEENDSLFIPTNPQSVQIMGAVYNQTALVYDKNRSVTSYINLAGGYNELADKNKTYILKVDGTAVKPQKVFSSMSWDSGSHRWESGRNLEPGDTIIVPEKLEKISWMRHIKDITQILYQIATAAGVIIVAY